MKSFRRLRQHQHGFTLIEVMVAVAIVALAVSALLFSVGKQVDSSSYLREKILAQWVALNILQETQLTARVTEKFPDEQDSGDIKFANRQWRWEMQTTKTDSKDFVKLEVKIYPEENNDDGDPLATATGYVDNYYKLKKISNRNGDFNIGDEENPDDENGTDENTEEEPVDDSEIDNETISATDEEAGQ